MSYDLSKKKLSELMEGVAVECANINEKRNLLEILEKEGELGQDGTMPTQCYLPFDTLALSSEYGPYGRLLSGTNDVYKRKHIPIKPFSELITKYYKINPEPIMENYADRSKWILEPFDTQRVEKGDLVCTELGVIVKHVTFNDKGVQGTIESSLAAWNHWKLDGSPCWDIQTHLFHPVPVKAEVKKKRIPFDASRVNEEGVRVVCRNDEDTTFISILKTDLKHEKNIISVFEDKLGVEFIAHHWPDGRVNKISESDFDLFLEVPDTEPALPSMQEVADAVKNSYLGHAMVYMRKHANPLADRGQLFNRLTAKVVVECLAEYLNDGWGPDWSNDKLAKTHYAYCDKRGLYLQCVTLDNGGSVYLKSKKTAKLFRKILNSWEPNDAILLRALGVK